MHADVSVSAHVVAVPEAEVGARCCPPLTQARTSAPNLQRRQHAPILPRQATPPSLSAGAHALAQRDQHLSHTIATSASVSAAKFNYLSPWGPGGGWRGRAEAGARGEETIGSGWEIDMTRPQARVDPTVALLVKRLEAAVCDMQYHKQRADTVPIPSQRPPPRDVSTGDDMYADTDSRCMSGPGVELRGAEAGERREFATEANEAYMCAVQVREMALRLQSTSTAALTVSVDLCWCRCFRAFRARLIAKLFFVCDLIAHAATPACTYAPLALPAAIACSQTPYAHNARIYHNT